jgi:acyl carrier protein
MEVIDDVRAIIAKSLKLPIEQLTADARLDELGAESLDVIEIIFALEEKFDITIPDNVGDVSSSKAASGAESEDIKFSTIGDIAGIVERLVGAKASR